jgi:hypothetical protein
MRKILMVLLTLTMVLSFVSKNFTNELSYSLPSIPKTFAEFKELRAAHSKTPEGAAALFVAAMIMYGKNKEDGIKSFTLILDRYYVWKGGRGPSVRGYSPNRSAMGYIKMIDTRPYLGRVYISGTNYKNAYKLPAAPYKIEIARIGSRGEGKKVLYIRTTSGNMPRPLGVKVNNRGVWKAYDLSSMFVGVSKVPPRNVDDDI